MSIDGAAVTIGGLRMASGLSFLVDPVAANKLWGSPETPDATAQLLLRSMGYRDALIGGLLLGAGARGRGTRGWFLASAGADVADLIGGLGVHGRLTRGQQIVGLGGAVVGIVAGLWGATRRRSSGRSSSSGAGGLAPDEPGQGASMMSRRYSRAASA